MLLMAEGYCAPGTPRIEADPEDLVAWDPNVKFTPADVSSPRMGEPVELIEDEAAAAAHELLKTEGKGTPIPDTLPLRKVAMAWLNVPNELFKNLERYTQIPFYRWYRAIEDSRLDVERHTFEPF